MICSSISCFLEMKFVLSFTTNFFLDRSFLLMSYFQKSGFSGLWVYNIVDTFIIAPHPAVAKKICNLVFIFLSHSVFQLLCSSACSETSLLPIEKIGILERQLISYQTRNCCDVICKFSSIQSLIKQYLTNVSPDVQVWHKAFFR